MVCFTAMAQGRGRAEKTSPGPSPSLKEIDELLATTSVLTKDLEDLVGLSLARESNLNADQCRAHALSLIQERAAFGPIEPPDFAWAQPAENYYHCIAFAERNPDLCRPLKAFRFGHHHGRWADDERDCRLDYENMVLTRAFISNDPQAQAVCIGLFRRRGLEDARRLCSIILEGRHVEADCAKALPMLNAVPGGEGTWEGEKMTHPGCVKWLARIRADEESLPLFSKDLGDSLGYQYKKALAAGNPALCGPTNPQAANQCRIILGLEGRRCDTLLEAVQAGFCGPWVRRKMAEERHSAGKTEILAAVSQNRDRVMALMSRLEALINAFEPKDLPALQARKDRFLSQRRTLELTLRRFEAWATGRQPAGTY